MQYETCFLKAKVPAHLCGIWLMSLNELINLKADMLVHNLMKCGLNKDFFFSWLKLLIYVTFTSFSAYHQICH